MKTSVREIDKVIHQERIDEAGKKVTHQRMSADIPEGAFLIIHDEPYLLSKGMLHRWTPFGYDKTIPLPEAPRVTVLTPKSIVNAFNAGYRPQIKISSEQP
jgi:hypothetical protein